MVGGFAHKLASAADGGHTELRTLLTWVPLCLLSGLMDDNRCSSRRPLCLGIALVREGRGTNVSQGYKLGQVLKSAATQSLRLKHQYSLRNAFCFPNISVQL